MQTIPAIIERRYISLTEAQTYSGLSRDTLERLARERRLTVFRPRGKRMFDLIELDRLIRESAASA